MDFGFRIWDLDLGLGYLISLNEIFLVKDESILFVFKKIYFLAKKTSWWYSRIFLMAKIFFLKDVETGV